ncbi:MAG TPA: alpha/beta hydrolase [Burkholderiaceae bacterium]|nr:alpha/beta hydrolase [Burkholderiaceae bacterium]
MARSLFKRHRSRQDGVTINAVVGGDGPPLLMLHGYPQSHAMWHRVAPTLARERTVVCADLRGYGDSSKPRGVPDHSNYSKRAMAADMVALMHSLGHARFDVVGHDRGGRVAHRLARDHGERVRSLTVLDISPTLAMYEQTTMAFARAYYHWFLFIQPAPLPETMVAAVGLKGMFGRHGINLGSGSGVFDPRALAEYLRCFDARTIHASCEDYRAAAGIDLEHDRADLARKLALPVLAVWGTRGVVGRQFDCEADWRAVAHEVSGHALDCGHFIAEERPAELLQVLQPFLLAADATR